MSFWEKHKKVILLYSLVAFLLVIMLADTFVPEARDIYNTTEVQVMEAVVVDKIQEDDSNYLRLSVPSISASPLEAQTTIDFYQQANQGQKVGALVGVVETYTARPSWNKEQLKIKYVSKGWEVLSVYPTLADARNENQFKTFTTTASLKQRIKSLDGRYYFLFNVGGKKVMAEVSNDYYHKYRPQKTAPEQFELEFAGNGDFNHLVRILKPKS